MRKILLNKSTSKVSVNNTNGIPIELNRDTSLFHNEITSDTIDTMQVYNNDKDKSNKHRFIFTINPICTNAIFNKLTEIIHKEGSSETYVLSDDDKSFTLEGTVSNSVVTRMQAIRNTEYSNSEYNMTYHCGADIFNNHLLRAKNNVSVQKRKTYFTIEGDKNEELNNACHKYEIYDKENNFIGEKDGFNTIGDISRTFDGDCILSNQTGGDQLYALSDNNVDDSIKLSKKLPLYLYDEINSFHTAFNEGVIRKDGWVGFTNRSTMQIPVVENDGKKYFVNKCINNKEACQFIDMCPERDLFYFTPKKNNYRKRLEYNWDYFLTYPSESVYDDNLILKGKGKGLPLYKIDKKYYEEYNGANGMVLLRFRSIVKHNLKAGDYIHLKDSKNNNIKCYVVSIGGNDKKDKPYCFSVYKSDVEAYTTNLSSINRFAKVSSNYECEYYFRKFSKFPIAPHSTLNKLSFANTIYGDEVSQIVFTESLDINDYRDNRGRPLTEIYLTILKSNRGYKEWYDDKKYTSNSIEYSHIFGRVSSGLDLPPYVGTEYPVVRKQHCIGGTGNSQLTIKSNNKDYIIEKSSVKIKNESNITKNMDSFYGDLVEFNPVDVTETILEEVYHRFNTAQRETRNNTYTTLKYDEVYLDIYDAQFQTNDETAPLPKIKEYTLNEGLANIDPEGYIYKPHHKIQIALFSSRINQLSDKAINTTSCSLSNNELTFTTTTNYVLTPGDIICTTHKETYKIYNFIVKEYKFNNTTNVYTCVCSYPGGDITIPISQYYIFKHNLEIPDYSYMLPDGTGRHLWRDVVKPSELSYNDSLYDTPFANGAFYHHKNIMFYVRRQDPFHQYKMFIKDKETGEQIENNFNIPSTEFDISTDEYVQESDYKSCSLNIK